MKAQEFWLGAGGGCVGGLFGAVCGSSSLLVVGIVGGFMGFMAVWLASSFLK